MRMALGDRPPVADYLPSSTAWNTNVLASGSGGDALRLNGSRMAQTDRTSTALTAPAVLSVLLVAFVALCCAYSVHLACFDPPPPVTRPDSSTPRGGYCDAIETTRPWISLTVVPTLAMAILAFALRRRPWALSAIAGLGSAAMIANAIYAHSLVSALTA
jgi:hypothetical protein